MNTDAVSMEIFIKGIFAAVFGFIMAWGVFSRQASEIDPENTESKGQRYATPIFGALLPIFILCLTVLGFMILGAVPTAQMALSICFGVFLHISLYYAILMLLLPFLRKHVSARACAILWLIPNYLYVTTLSCMEVPEPLIIIRAPGNWVWALFGIWLAGFAFVLLWKTASHFRFRRRILKYASPVSDKAVLDLWQQEIHDAKIEKPKFQLVVSPGIASPLTVGLFRRSMRVVLPERPYSPDELRLIFRHEIVHISRQDSWSKFFLVFCTAMCWFNPLMWAAMRKSADDMELSCDETVLLKADGETRRQYASLLLSAAGDGRGFTTCLSAAASSMRYRLKSVMQPRRRHSGAVLVGLAFFILCMTCGYVALAYGDSTGEDVLFQHQDHSQFRIRSIIPTGAHKQFKTPFDFVDEAAFNDYLAGLEMDDLTGNYSFSQFERQYTCIYDTPEGTMGVVLSDHSIKLAPLYDDSEAVRYYYLPEGVDWDYLDTILMSYPAMNLHLNEADSAYGIDNSATLDKLTVVENGGETLLYDRDQPEEEYSGVYGYAPYEAVFSFSYELAGPFTVEIESWDRASSYTVTQDELEEPFTVPLPAYPAHYRVCAAFAGKDGELYQAEFRFEIGEIDSG